MSLVYNPTETHSSQIIIIGGGPVGLFGALCAARRGLAVTLLDRGFRGYARGHATLLHSATLRLLAEFGLASKLLAAGRPVAHVDLHLDADYCTSLELPTPALSVAQSAFEEIMLHELRLEEVEIDSPWTATGFTQSTAGVEVHATRREVVPLGSPTCKSDWQPVQSSVLHAQFLIGADGRESVVRSGLGIETTSAGERETYAMFEGPRSMPRLDFELSFSRGLGGVTLPLANDCARWSFQLGSGTELTPDIDHLRALLSERAAWEPEPPQLLHWAKVTHFDRYLARRFGRGRVWLAGDAAHVTSPFGGQSVNSGLLEIHELIEHMAGCLAGKDTLGSLERLAAQREREWQKLLGFDVRWEPRPSTPKPVVDYARRIVPALPGSGRDLQNMLTQLGLTVY